MNFVVKGHLKLKTKMKSEDCKTQVIPPSHNREDPHAIPARGVAESMALEDTRHSKGLHCSSAPRHQGLPRGLQSDD